MCRRMRTWQVAVVGLMLAPYGCNSPMGPILPPTPAPMSPLVPPIQFTLSPGTPIAVPALVEGTVRPVDPACYHSWDSSGRCVFFTATAPADGRLTLTLRWGGTTSDMDLFYIVSGLPTRSGDEGNILNVRAGQEVTTFVMSYAAPQDFKLETSFQP